jgi:hypothetical protein
VGGEKPDSASHTFLIDICLGYVLKSKEANPEGHAFDLLLEEMRECLLRVLPE